MPRRRCPCRSPARRTLLQAVFSCGLFACQSGGSMDAIVTDAGAIPPPSTGPDDRASKTFCERDRSDAVRDVFCDDVPPVIGGLTDLEALFGLDFLAPTNGTLDTDGADYAGGSIEMRVAFLGLSTALSGELVSPINPRAILLGSSVILAFNRGVQQVELATRDRNSGAFNFYLVSFEQACNTSPGGCSFGDLYTPRVEADWNNVRIEDDEDLKNTPSDCRQCHQRGRETSMLLMRELQGPWTHFFAPDPDGNVGVPEPSGSDLLRDYLLAKGDEPYAGIRTGAVRATVGFALQSVVDIRQPLLFDGSAILNERWPWTSDGYPSEPQRSPTWYDAYEGFKRGEYLPLPHFDPRPTDPVKQAGLTEAYQRYRSGELAADDLPDLADIFPDDPQVRAEIGLRTEPFATPAQVLIQACGTCHNDVLDQSLSRARFSIDLARMNREELDIAITRLESEPEAPGVMPPPGRRQLDDVARERLIEYLERDSRPPEDDALLARAARLGMAMEQPQQTTGFSSSGSQER